MIGTWAASSWARFVLCRHRADNEARRHRGVPLEFRDPGEIDEMAGRRQPQSSSG